VYWNNRVVRTTVDDTEKYEIHEVYYDANDKIEAWTRDAVAPYGETLEELREDILHMLRAVDNAPVLNAEDLPGGKADG
jgi:hypothetical protein